MFFPWLLDVFSGFQSKLICRNWRQWKKPMMSKSFLPWLGASIKKLQREKGHIELRRGMLLKRSPYQCDS